MSDSEHPAAITSELHIADAECEARSAEIQSYAEREVTLSLTPEGFEAFIRELRLEEHDDAADDWLDAHSPVRNGDGGTFGGDER